ncbi:MAG: bifunctional hydroxymethylpyrimidine kinase/phosphomethylpyrimidine kinase [Polyangiales bacterium]
MSVALTVAGSDPAGGAGIQGDLRTFSSLSVHGASVLTSVIAQATRGVREAWPLSAAQVRRQLEVVLEDLSIDAAKTGVLATAENVRAVSDVLAGTRFPLVVDPVIASSSGAELLDREGVRAVLDRLMPRATLITPNAPEIGILLGIPAPRGVDELARAAESLIARGAAAVLAKGGHLDGDPVDVLATNRVQIFRDTRIDTACTRGTGCTLSAAIVAEIAHGLSLEDAVTRARTFLRAAMLAATPLGPGSSPVDVIAGARAIGR